MNPWRGRQAGFTLTEILMAMGILGIGLTMVASVFPVAVDQSRRSYDSTMAALSASSVCATIRAQRDKIMPWLRKYGRDGLLELTTNTRTKVPLEMRNYNPGFFLYYVGEAGYQAPPTGGTIGPPSRHDVTRTYVNFPRSSGVVQTGYNSTTVLWNAGGFVPVVFATPMNEEARTPFLLAIVIYKSKGMPPFNLDQQADPACYLKQWQWAGKDRTQQLVSGRVSAGSYVLDWPGYSDSSDPTSLLPCNLAINRGAAYLVDRVVATEGQDTGIFLAPTPDKNSGKPYTFKGTVVEASTLRTYITLPGATAVYHTVLGD